MIFFIYRKEENLGFLRERERWEEEVHTGIMTLNKGKGEIVVFIRLGPVKSNR